MRKNKHILTRVIACILVMIMAMTAIPFGGFCASAAGTVVKSGACGENGDKVKFALYSDGTLVFSGKGRLKGYSEEEFSSYMKRTCPYASYQWHETDDEFDAFSGYYTGDETVKKVIINSGITAIGNYAFYDFSALTTVVIPDTVTEIGYNAFGYCKSLKAVSMPKNLTDIGAGAFSGCKVLNNIVLPDSVRTVSSSSFYDTSFYNNKSNRKNGLLFSGKVLLDADESTVSGNVTIPSGIKVLAEGCFQDCSKLTGIVMPDGITVIPIGTFSGCTKLKSVQFPKTLVEIRDSAFSDCSSLSNISIPSTVKTIGHEILFETAYYNNSKNWKNGLLYCGKSLVAADSDKVSGTCTILSGTTALAKRCFDSCKMTSVVIPDSVTVIPAFAFIYCHSLQSVRLPSRLTLIDSYAFEECSRLKTVSIPDSVKVIRDSAFDACESLQSVKLSSKLTTVNSCAFYDTSIKEITVPSSVTKIDEYAFGYYTNTYGYRAKVSGFTVKGYNNTAAQKYAKDNGFKFVSLDVHKHTVKSPKITKATFTKDGVSTGTCSGCKKTVKTVIYKVSYVKLSATKYAYNGKIHTPAVTVKDSKGKTLKLNTDYTVSYSSGRKYPGQYAVKITLKGNYSGTRTLYYSIVPATPTLQVSAGYGRAYLKWNKQVGANGYVIYMATSKNGAYKRVAVAKSNAYTLLKLTKGRTYYFKVAAYKTVGSKNLYGSFSTAKAVKIK